MHHPSLLTQPNSHMHPAPFISRQAAGMANDGSCMHGSSSTWLPSQGGEQPSPWASPLLLQHEGEKSSEQKRRGMGTAPQTLAEEKQRNPKIYQCFSILSHIHLQLQYYAYAIQSTREGSPALTRTAQGTISSMWQNMRVLGYSDLSIQAGSSHISRKQATELEPWQFTYPLRRHK